MPLETYFLPGDLNARIERFVTYYNHHRYFESIGNLTPANINVGRGWTILLERGKNKQNTISQWRLQYRNQAASDQHTDEPILNTSRDEANLQNA